MLCSFKKKYYSPLFKVTTLHQKLQLLRENSCIMADTDMPFPSTLGKPETQTLGGSVIGNFSVRSILKKCQPFFNFFIMANTDMPFPLTCGIPETQTLGGSVFGNFSV